MNNADERKLRVFYSWQSNLTGLVNMKLIRNALNDAAVAINGDIAKYLHAIINEVTLRETQLPKLLSGNL